MTTRLRLVVLTISVPVMAYALVGGYLGQAMEREKTYQHLRVFEDVVSLVLSNYVEEVDVQDAMRGAMNGLADGLDTDSAYLTPDLVEALESGDEGGTADVGLELGRQYYLQVVAAPDGTPGAAAGVRAGDFIRAIDNRPTRDMSVYEGVRLLRGKPGSTVSLLIIRGNAAEPYVVDLVRTINEHAPLESRLLTDDIGYLKVSQFSSDVPALMQDAIEGLSGQGASRWLLDLRGATRGEVAAGIEAARLFVRQGTLTLRSIKGADVEAIDAGVGDGAVAQPVVLLVDQGTAGGAEVFAAALGGNDRAGLVGQRTSGRAAEQRLVKLPDGSGLWLSFVQYLAPGNEPLHQRGLVPDVRIDAPVVPFGESAPTVDEALDRAIVYLDEIAPA